MEKDFDLSDISVLILAGQRSGVHDPLCEMAQTDQKALIPILGKPMIDYPLDALEQAGLSTPYYVSGLNKDHDKRLKHKPGAGGPADSAVMAIESGIPFPILMTTCDHALLSKEMIQFFIQGSRATGADFCAGFAEEKVIQPAYPNVKRTYLKFKDGSVSGCNLFYIANEEGLEVIRFWRRAQSYRKQPLKLAASVGFFLPILYFFKQLSMTGAFKHASRKLGIVAKPVLIPIAEAAIDVDKPSDLELVEQILSRQA